MELFSLAIFFSLQFIEGFALYLIISTFSGLKDRISLFKVLTLSILHGTVYYVIDKLFPLQLHGIILIVLSILISTLILELDFILSLISTLISAAIIMTIDLILSLCFLTIFNMSVDQLMKDYFLRTSLTFVVQMFFLISALIIHKRNICLPKKYFLNKKTSMLVSSLFFIVCVFAVFAFIISIYVKDQQPFMYIFLIITFISFSLVMYKLNQYIVSMAVKEIQLEDQNIYIEYIKELMNHLKSQRHEYINHINVLYGLVQFNDLSRLKTAKEYIENLNITIQGTSSIMAAAEPVVSGLLFTKTTIAEQKNIEMDIHITDQITNTQLSLTEISIVLNNLINNAIEFSEILPEENRYICLEIIGDEEHIYIDICNENNGNPIDDKDIIFKKGFSTKPNDEEFRGFGLYNIKTIIEKYHGSIQVESDQHETSFKIILPKKK